MEEKENQLEKKIYFSMPELDGSFLISNGRDENDGRCFYKILYSENLDRGRLSYISHGRDKRAINRYEAYLKPVCDVENYDKLESSNVVLQTEQGEVIKHENKWTINKDKKVKVRFE